MTEIGNTKLPNFSCEKCNIITSNKKDYTNHLLTRKHKNSADRQQEFPNISQQHACSHCDKKYESRSGLWRHMKKCTIKSEDLKEKAPEEVKTLTTLVMELMKSNSDLQKQLVDSCKNNTISTNNTNNSHNIHNNSHNKTFNLQFFLNEQCKDAMNISDFVNTFELQLEDLESVGELGYIEGITKIIVDKLNSMDIYKRPMHCSDAKREILYVKDGDVWAKEERSNPKLRKAIKSVSFKNMKIAVLWSDTYPESKDGDSRLNDTYMKLIKESTGGNGEIGDSENKIIRRIAKEIVIDKMS